MAEPRLPLVVFGDSHTKGTGASRPAKAYAPLLAGRLDRPLVQLGYGGAGFVHPGPRRGLRPVGPLGRHAHRIPRERALLVLQIPAHDRSYPIEAVRDALDAFLAALAGGPVLLVGPLWAKHERDLLVAGRRMAADAARSRGLRHVGAEEWISPPLVGPDGAHFNDAGHQAVADHIAGAIREAGLL